MASGFDPYYVWLGIPPADQPPHHYRLLGLVAFEENRTVIEAAADRQMTFLRQHGSGEHSEASQRLLNEISKTLVILLNPQRKASYDAQLRQTLEAKTPSASPKSPIADPLAASAFAGFEADFVASPSTKSEQLQSPDEDEPWSDLPAARRPRKRTSADESKNPLSKGIPASWIAAGAGGLFLLALVAWIVSRPGRTTSATGESDLRVANQSQRIDKSPPTDLLVPDALPAPTPIQKPVEPPVKPVSAPNADRAAARWILSKDGRVTIRQGDKESDISLAAQLPKNDFQLVAVLFDQPSSHVTAEGMESLRGLTHLKRFMLHNNSGVTDDMLAPIATLTSLEYLQVTSCPITDSALSHFAGLTKLQHLLLNTTQVTGAGFAHLKACRELVALLFSWTPLDNAQLVHLRNFPQLRDLTLVDSGLDDVGMQAIGQCESLSSLHFRSPKVSPEGLARLEGCPRLLGLAIDGNHLPPDAFAALARIPALTNLSLLNTMFDESDWKRVAAIPNLRLLQIADSPVTAEGIEASMFPNLFSLDVLRTKLTAEGLRKVATLETLGRLVISHPPSDTDAILSLGKLSKVRELMVLEHDLPPETLEALQKALPEAKITATRRPPAP